MASPEVTVVIPTRDRWSMAARAAGSALEQLDVEIEVIVVDDGSTEGAPQGGPFADERLRVVRNPTPRGLPGARNRGVAEARTEWVAFLDDDDLWAPEKLRSQLRAARETSAELAYCAAYLVDADLRVRALDAATPVEALPSALLSHNAVPAAGSNILVRREVLTEHGGFDETFPHLCDWDLSLRLTDDGVRIAALDDPLIAYVQHEGNMGAARGPRLVPEWRRFRRKHHALARRRGGRFSSDALILWYVWRLQLAGRRWRAAAAGVVWGVRLRNLELLRGRAATILWPSLTAELLPPAYPGPPWLPQPPHRKEASWANAARQIERSWSWRIGRSVVGAFRLLTLRRPILPRGPAALAASIEESAPQPRSEDQPVDFGDLRRMEPVSPVWGFDRGQPIDRHYIERFLAARSAAIRGRVLEIGDTLYTDMFGGGRVTQSEILDVLGNPDATYTCRLEEGDDLPSESFDCVILTQTLQLIYDVRGALRTLHRILRPGGTVLCTVPGITRISQEEYEDSWYWSFTGASVTALFSEVFPRDSLDVEAFGNVLAASGFLYGLAASELAGEELDHLDPNYEMIIGAAARK